MPDIDQSNVTRKVPPSYTDERVHRRLLAEGVNAALDGRIFPVFDVSLAVSPATTTTVNDRRVSSRTAVIVLPTDATTAGELTSIYVAPGDQSFVINHPANVSARTVRCVLLG